MSPSWRKPSSCLPAVLGVAILAFNPSESDPSSPKGHRPSYRVLSPRQCLTRQAGLGGEIWGPPPATLVESSASPPFLLLPLARISPSNLLLCFTCLSFPSFGPFHPVPTPHLHGKREVGWVVPCVFSRSIIALFSGDTGAACGTHLRLFLRLTKGQGSPSFCLGRPQ